MCNEQPFMEDSEGEELLVGNRRRKWTVPEQKGLAEVMREAVRGQGDLSCHSGKAMFRIWWQVRQMLKLKYPKSFRTSNAYFQQWMLMVARFLVRFGIALRLLSSLTLNENVA